ncbi:hypothetical protein Acr_16g0009900 [Actinidia rufa]|uniref:Uncharacterized protein n=1 Tax=Actinidia rufa TaxID=165716 RepID=A0A7J0G0A6_9ERIC|nr:hypothetical protein Acr_16g0009900 [Actinidia rufa]
MDHGRTGMAMTERIGGNGRDMDGVVLACGNGDRGGEWGGHNKGGGKGRSSVVVEDLRLVWG